MKPLDEMTPEEIRIEIARRKHDAVWTEVPDGRGHFMPPNWPEDIAAAWELVEDSQEKPHELYFDIEAIVCISNKWRATVGYHSRIADTAPLAICRAWLAWKRSEE